MEIMMTVLGSLITRKEVEVSLREAGGGGWRSCINSVWVTYGCDKNTIKNSIAGGTAPRT